MTARSKVKSRSNHDVAPLYLLPNVPTKYQLPTPNGFWGTARTNFFPPNAHLPGRTPSHPDSMGENNTPTALKGCGVLIISLDIIYIYTISLHDRVCRQILLFPRRWNRLSVPANGSRIPSKCWSRLSVTKLHVWCWVWKAQLSSISRWTTW